MQRRAARPAAPPPGPRPCRRAARAPRRTPRSARRGPHHHERGLADVGQVDATSRPPAAPARTTTSARTSRASAATSPTGLAENRATTRLRSPSSDPSPGPAVRSSVARVRDRQQVRPEAAGQLQRHARRREQARQHDPRGPLRAHQRRRELGQPPPVAVVGALGHGDQHAERVGLAQLGPLRLGDVARHDAVRVDAAQQRLGHDRRDERHHAPSA